jgi:hypothetical protein
MGVVAHPVAFLVRKVRAGDARSHEQFSGCEWLHTTISGWGMGRPRGRPGGRGWVAVGGGGEATSVSHKLGRGRNPVPMLVRGVRAGDARSHQQSSGREWLHAACISKKSGNEVACTNSVTLPVKNMLCSKLYFYEGFNLTACSNRICCAPGPHARPRSEGGSPPCFLDASGCTPKHLDGCFMGGRTPGPHARPRSGSARCPWSPPGPVRASSAPSSPAPPHSLSAARDTVV